jgi:hypothetical protein
MHGGGCRSVLGCQPFRHGMAPRMTSHYLSCHAGSGGHPPLIIEADDEGEVRQRLASDPWVPMDMLSVGSGEALVDMA